jgi:hypothetical protein
MNLIRSTDPTSADCVLWVLMINSHSSDSNALLGYTSMRYRLASRSDLPTFVGLLHPGFRMRAGIRERLVQLWADLLVSPGRCAVIEDPSRPYPACIEGFGATVFVTDAFIERIVERPRPYVAATLYEEVLAGRSPVLSDHEVAQANARAGLNLLALPFGLRNHDMSDHRTQRVLQCASAAFYYLHAGYGLRALVQEVFGRQQAAYMEAGGFRLVSDYSDLDEVVPIDRTPANHPSLYALRREWVVQGAANPLSFLFQSPRPHIGLSPAEQRVLFRALCNETDGEIGRSLGISLEAVKKTWRRTFDRVARAAPYALGTTRVTATERRGAEKRRFLLEYLRLHPEELRPYKPDSTPAAGKR